MLEFRIPKGDLIALRTLVTAETAQLEALNETLSLARGILVEPQLEKLVSRHLGTEHAAAVAQLLIRLLGLRRVHDATASDIASAIRAAVEKQSTEGKADIEAFDRARGAFEALIANAALELLQKARELAVAHANVLLESRIITDVRPVFDTDGQKPLLGIVAHTLRLTLMSGTTDDHERTVSIALDQGDLRSLAEQIARALTKVDALKAVMGSAMEHGLFTPGDEGDDDGN